MVKSIEERLTSNIESYSDPCKTIIDMANKMLDTYQIKDDFLIPHTLFVWPLYMTSTMFCNFVIQIMTSVDNSRVCENSERNKKLFEEYRDKGENKKKLFCERAYFLKKLHLCRPKAADIEKNLGRQISRLEVSDELSFIEACW